MNSRLSVKDQESAEYSLHNSPSFHPHVWSRAFEKDYYLRSRLGMLPTDAKATNEELIKRYQALHEKLSNDSQETIVKSTPANFMPCISIPANVSDQERFRLRLIVEELGIGHFVFETETGMYPSW